MEVHLRTDLQAKLDELARETGRPYGELLEDAVAEYFEEIRQTRQLLDGRYDDLKSGRVQPVDGEKFFEDLRRREEELVNRQARR